MSHIFLNFDVYTPTGNTLGDIGGGTGERMLSTTPMCQSPKDVSYRVSSGVVTLVIDMSR